MNTITAGRTNIPPFWSRLPAIALYPLRGPALISVLGLTLASLLTYIPLIGWLIAIALWLAVYKFGFEALRATADGWLDPVDGSFNVDGSLVWRFLGLILIFVVAVFVVTALSGPYAGWLAMVIVAFALPGATMSLAIDESALHAANPATWMSLIARIGWPYFAVVALLFVFQVSSGNAAGLLAPWLPPIVDRLVPAFFGNWLVIATFHLMGYLIYQYHEALGYEPQRHAADLPQSAQDRDQALLDAAARDIREGRPETALAELRGHVRTRAVSPAVHELYRKLLQQAGDRDALVRHGREFINLLLQDDAQPAANRERRALAIARECLDIDPDFTAPLPEHTHTLAQRADQLGQTRLATDLLAAFRRRHPKHPDAPKNTLLEARLRCEKLGQDAEALALLRETRVRHPEDALGAEIDGYAAMIEKLGRTA